MKERSQTTMLAKFAFASALVRYVIPKIIIRNWTQLRIESAVVMIIPSTNVACKSPWAIEHATSTLTCRIKLYTYRTF